MDEHVDRRVRLAASEQIELLDRLGAVGQPLRRAEPRARRGRC